MSMTCSQPEREREMLGHRGGLGISFFSDKIRDIRRIAALGLSVCPPSSRNHLDQAKCVSEQLREPTEGLSRELGAIAIFSFSLATRRFSLR